MMGRLAGLDRAAARARARELLARFDLADAGRRRVADVLRRDAAAARPRREPRRPPGGALPRRADDRPRPAQPPGDVGGRSASSSTLGVTVFLTTQYLEEADRLADRIAVIDGGRVVAEGTPAELKRRVADQRLDLVLADADAFAAAARSLAGRTLVADPARPAARRGDRRQRGARARAARRGRPGAPRGRGASPSTAPPSTTSSWPSPAARGPTRPGDRRCLTSPRPPSRSPCRPRRGSPLTRRSDDGRPLHPPVDARSVDALITSLMLPVMLMLMFVYLFGGAIETGTALRHLRRPRRDPAVRRLRRRRRRR